MSLTFFSYQNKIKQNIRQTRTWGVVELRRLILIDLVSEQKINGLKQDMTVDQKVWMGCCFSFSFFSMKSTICVENARAKGEGLI